MYICEKNIVWVCCILSMFLLVTCNKDKKSNDISIEISESIKFSKDEIEDAIQCVRDNFSFPGANLTKIWYDEEKSNYLIDGYLENGNGVEVENTIRNRWVAKLPTSIPGEGSAVI